MRKLYQLARLLHIYISTALFALLLFFCVTGILLNHNDWLSDSYQSGEHVWALPEALAQQMQPTDNEVWQPPLTALQQFIQQQAPQLAAVNKVDIDAETQEVMLDYQIPAGYVFVTIAEGEALAEYQTGHWLSVLNDLHKGRHSGKAWSLVIDLSAVLMLLFAVTGMIILIQNRKRRLLGLVFTGLGLLTPWLLYIWFVPRL